MCRVTNIFYLIVLWRIDKHIFEKMKNSYFDEMDIVKNAPNRQTFQSCATTVVNIESSSRNRRQYRISSRTSLIPGNYSLFKVSG